MLFHNLKSAEYSSAVRRRDKQELFALLRSIELPYEPLTGRIGGTLRRWADFRRAYPNAGPDETMRLLATILVAADFIGAKVPALFELALEYPPLGVETAERQWMEKVYARIDSFDEVPASHALAAGIAVLMCVVTQWKHANTVVALYETLTTLTDQPLTGSGFWIEPDGGHGQFFIVPRPNQTGASVWAGNPTTKRGVFVADFEGDQAALAAGVPESAKAAITAVIRAVGWGLHDTAVAFRAAPVRAPVAYASLQTGDEQRGERSFLDAGTLLGDGSVFQHPPIGREMAPSGKELTYARDGARTVACEVCNNPTVRARYQSTREIPYPPTDPQYAEAVEAAGRHMGPCGNVCGGSDLPESAPIPPKVHEGADCPHCPKREIAP